MKVLLFVGLLIVVLMLNTVREGVESKSQKPEDLAFMNRLCNMPRGVV